MSKKKYYWCLFEVETLEFDAAGASRGIKTSKVQMLCDRFPLFEQHDLNNKYANVKTIGHNKNLKQAVNYTLLNWKELDKQDEYDACYDLL